MPRKKIKHKKPAFFVSTKNQSFDFVEKGNIDINNRPVIKNKDNSISTELSFSIGTDKGEILLPRIVNGKLLSFNDAVKHYRKTGEHLGIFKDINTANSYAELLHNRFRSDKSNLVQQKKIDLIGPRLRELAKKHAAERQQRNKVPGNSAWERLKWVVENEWLAPVSRVGANVNPFSKKSERGKASIADLFQATAMGIGSGWPAAGRGASAVGILKKDILREMKSSSRYMRDYSSIEEGMKKVLKLFKDEYLDVAPVRGNKLEDFKVYFDTTGGGVYNFTRKDIKLKYVPGQFMANPWHRNYAPSIVGHELTHWYNDFIKDQVERFTRFDLTALKQEQFDETRKIFADFLSDFHADPDIPAPAKKFVAKKEGFIPGREKELLKEGENFKRIARFYKDVSFMTEHASVAWENVFRPGTIRWGTEVLGGDSRYVPTKSFARAAKNLQEMGWHKEISDSLIEAAKRRWQGQNVDMAPFGRWYGRQTMDEKARLAKRFKRLIEEK